MGTIIKRQSKRITTSDGQVLVRRVTTVQLPNGRYRYPVDYYDATPGVVRVTQSERKQLCIPVYECLI